MGGRPHGHPRRIIPARAGFTRILPDGEEMYEDHPRSRGVYNSAHSERESHDGSSPLARGLLAWAFTAGEAARIIPARAGFT